MKKLICLFAAAMIALLSLAGCSGTGEKNGEAKEKKIKIIATIFPEYDWTRNILGEMEDEVELILLMDNGADLHNYQLTADDMLAMGDCDIFIYVGGMSDRTLMEAFDRNGNSSAVKVDLMEVLKDEIREEEQVEGMEPEDEHDEDTEYDEHVWLSLNNAKKSCEAIAEALISVDGEHKDVYLSNLEKYTAKLDELDERYENAVESSDVRLLVFRDRFPFRYLVDDYGLGYYAAFSGCSAETEASFETIIFLSEKIDSNSLNSIMKIETSDGRIAEAVRDNTVSKNREILTLDSMQSKTMKDVLEGADYLNIMEGNLEVLKTALSR